MRKTLEHRFKGLILILFLFLMQFMPITGQALEDGRVGQDDDARQVAGMGDAREHSRP